MLVDHASQVLGRADAGKRTSAGREPTGPWAPARREALSLAKLIEHWGSTLFSTIVSVLLIGRRRWQCWTTFAVARSTWSSRLHPLQMDHESSPGGDPMRNVSPQGPLVGQKRKRPQVGAPPECDCGGEVVLLVTKYGENEGREYWKCRTCTEWLQWKDDKSIPVPKCDCGLKARKATVRHGLPHNIGKEFYGCRKYPQPDHCRFFIWADGTEPFGPESFARFGRWMGSDCLCDGCSGQEGFEGHEGGDYEDEGAEDDGSWEQEGVEDVEESEEFGRGSEVDFEGEEGEEEDEEGEDDTDADAEEDEEEGDEEEEEEAGEEEEEDDGGEEEAGQGVIKIDDQTDEDTKEN
ncbi:hypothetical protein KFL_000480220 [Klebsormidium nitens]|uniref:GRF-type domain-containing protein n=1 Tax=Klebsormidium nitens TaxID=105231 RepID=A0A1Y1HT50_KLENI|nr:hypothetical protein KFL_000480220 [Klebsormidium nitens]|eukprot:GAQ80181.1 hypothetical protein KFL_000480220 [Klebsormidium nitens]